MPRAPRFPKPKVAGLYKCVSCRYRQESGVFACLGLKVLAGRCRCILIPWIAIICYPRDLCICMCAYLLHISFVFLRLLIVALNHSQSNIGNTMAISGL